MFWWCSSRGKLASTAVAGTPGLQRADVVPEMVARGCWAPGGARLSGLRVAARRGETSPGGGGPRGVRARAI